MIRFLINLKRCFLFCGSSAFSTYDADSGILYGYVVACNFNRRAVIKQVILIIICSVIICTDKYVCHKAAENSTAFALARIDRCQRSVFAGLVKQNYRFFRMQLEYLRRAHILVRRCVRKSCECPVAPCTII